MHEYLAYSFNISIEKIQKVLAKIKGFSLHIKIIFRPIFKEVLSS